MAASEADTFAGAMGRLQAETANAAAELGDALLPYVTQVVDALGGFATWASENQTVVMVIAGIIGGLAAVIIGLNVAMSIWTAVTAAWSVATAIATAVGGAFAAVVAVITSPVFLVIAAIVALIAIVVLLWKNWDTVSEALGKAWDWLKEKATTIFNGIKDFLGGVWDSITTKVSEIWNGIKTWLATKWDEIKTTASTAFENLKTAITEKLTAIQTWFTELPGKILAALGGLGTTLLEKGKEIIKGFIDGYTGLLSDVTSWFTALPGKALDAIGNIGSKLYDKGKDLIQGFIDGIKSMGGKILDAILGILPSSVRGVISGALGLGRSMPGTGISTARMGVAPRAAYGSATFNFNGGAGTDARTVKRLLEGYDVRQGRAPGKALAVAW
jgi:phage-related minor tail protein